MPGVKGVKEGRFIFIRENRGLLYVWRVMPGKSRIVIDG